MPGTSHLELLSFLVLQGPGLAPGGRCRGDAVVAARLPPEPQVSWSPSLPFATGVHPGRVAPSPSTSSSQTPPGMSTFSCMLVSSVAV